MITWHDLYNVLSAMVPLYFAMFLAYGSVRWWKIFTPDQCSGINRFVAVFAVPLLSFHFISTNNPYKFNFRFIAADTLQKLIILTSLTIWSNFPFRRKHSQSPSLGWNITLFSLSTLPNTLVMGIPLLIAMYGPESGSLMVQVVVLQCIIWYTLLLFLFEFRGAKLLISEQFPETAGSIVSFRVEDGVVSLDGRIETEAEVGVDGKIHVTVRKSNVSRSIGGIGGMGMMMTTPRASNLSGVEIYSMSSSRNVTPRESNFNHSDFYSMMGYNNTSNHNHHNNMVNPPRVSNFGSVQSSESRGPTPRPSNFEESQQQQQQQQPQQYQSNDSMSSPRFGYYPSNSNSNPYPTPNPEFVGGLTDRSSNNPRKSVSRDGNERKMSTHDTKELHMFVWSSSASPVSEVSGLPLFGGHHNHNHNHSYEYSRRRSSGDDDDDDGAKEIRMLVSTTDATSQQNNNGVVDTTKLGGNQSGGGVEVYGGGGDQFSFAGKVGEVKLDDDLHIGLSKLGSSSTVELHPELTTTTTGKEEEEEEAESGAAGPPKQMPPASVMTRLILIMVWRKLIRNPNTYSSLIGVIWSLIAFRWNVEMPKIIKGSISILSDAGLGMAMFSLGLFMALQPKIIACGNSVALYSMLVRFVTGPAVMAIASIIIGLKGDLLRIAIIQAALPQGIVPFVFSKEYNNHPAILSTAVIFGMLIALPIDLIYYILLRL